MQSGDWGAGQSEDECPSQPADWLRSYQVTQAWPMRALPGNLINRWIRGGKSISAEFAELGITGGFYAYVVGTVNLT